MGKVAIVDDEDYEWLSQYKWHAVKKPHKKGDTYYARRTYGTQPNQKQPLMHREILDAPDGVEVDHKDGDGLNNRRGNLRLASSSQNHMNASHKSNNTSGYKGVSWDKRDKKWIAVIVKDGIHHSLGRYRDQEDAIRAYDIAAIELFGEFARTNLPKETYEK